MKSILFTAILVLLFSGIVWATPTCTPPEMITEYMDCHLEKPVDTVVGDDVTVICVNKEKIGGRWIPEPMSGTRISITGYNIEDDPEGTSSVNADRNGEYTFKPRITGKYLIRVGEYKAWFDVGENPVKAVGIVTGGTVAPEPEPEAVVEAEPENATVEEPVVEPEAEPGLIDFVITCNDEGEEIQQASNFALLIMSLLIS